MDRRQMVVQRVREFFGDRTDDVLHMVRQDRQDLRGWEEPAHVRAALRRSVRAEGGPGQQDGGATITLVFPSEFGRPAGEPDRGQQREAVGGLLEAGANALEKTVRNAVNDITPEEVFGLECVLLLYGRPAVLINDGTLDAVPPYWNVLEDLREDVEMAQRGVGRIELLGHPEYDWAGTGFLVNENILMTTRRVVELFVESRNGAYQFRPGITTWMDYRSPYQCVASAGYRVRAVVGVHDRYDLALLEVERPQFNAAAPTPLALAALPPPQTEGRAVYLIGYPVRDARRNEPEPIARVFRDVYNVKRVQPGTLRGVEPFRDIHLLRHDCAPLGHSAGGCIVDLETHQILGLHVSGRYLENATAVPLWMLRDDPLLARCHVTMARAAAEELATVSGQVERLARTRHWPELRVAVANMYEQAFGKAAPEK